MCSGPGTSSLFTFVKKGARNIHVVIFLGQLYVIPVTFGGYTTIHFVLATLHQPIYLKFMEKKAPIFSVPWCAHNPESDKLTAISLLQQKLRGGRNHQVQPHPCH